jgi:RNA polymerase sigma-70 factor (ECF subfamily)
MSTPDTGPLIAMDEQAGSTTHLAPWLDRLRAGDPAARDALIEHACNRLRNLARRMLKGWPGVHRWEQTDDVLQRVLIRLHKALGSVQPQDVKGFFGLAARLTKQELIDLGRHHLGPQGDGANHASGYDLAAVQRITHTHLRFHELVESLSPEARAVVDLVFYEGMTLGEAADLLGVSERTAKRRWREARLALYEELKDECPLS